MKAFRIALKSAAFAVTAAIIALSIGPGSTLATAAHPSVNRLTDSSPDIVIARCKKTPDSKTESDGMVSSEIEVLNVLKGWTKPGAARMISQHSPKQEEQFLVFATYETDEGYRGYHTVESKYAVIPLQRSFSMRELKDISLFRQVELAWAHRLDTAPIEYQEIRGENGTVQMRVTSGIYYQYPSCVKIFDGKSFDGWEADSSTWSIVDGAMHGVGGTSRLAYTKADYGSFRLIFSSQMNPVNKDHLGVLFWGDRPADPSKPKIDNAGWIQFMPPHGAMWDYHPPMHHNLPHETIAEGSRDFTSWHVTELLCNIEKGTMRAAVDGVEIVRYSHPQPSERTDPETRIVPGPIGMFRHGGGTSEYRDIYVEADPKDDVLLTLRKP